jgi:hypothetical protein
MWFSRAIIASTTRVGSESPGLGEGGACICAGGGVGVDAGIVSVVGEDELPWGVGLAEPVCGAGLARHTGPCRAVARSSINIASLIVLDTIFPRTILVRQLKHNLQGGGGICRLPIAARRFELNCLRGANCRLVQAMA